MHVVAAVANEGVLTFDLAVPCEVFGWDRSYLGVEWYDFFVCAADPPPLRTCTGFSIDTPHRLDDLARADTVIIPGWSDPEHEPSAELVDALQEAYRRGARIASICIGAFVLGCAGLLDGRPCTTHWAFADQLSRRFPRARVDPDVLYVDDGQVLTSAGTAAGMDLCLHMVRTDHGVEVANGVARRVVMPPHREGGQAQYIERPVPETGDDGLQRACTWALEHLDESLGVEDLARHAAMSTRTFARRFRAAIGTTPGEWLLQQRLLLAQRLLETTDHSVDRVAHAVGFGTATTLRHHFAARVHTSPHAYRRTFRGEQPAV
ncbi:helix-turn-helix domain-containing protein [Nocardioides taihuensis]|uniref:Helix-turn-helix domain-containing protein n=1 Tax=Nocardioides taihuensis TaxID=1835606 RepID=A0ABW0BN17_9ACTN